MVFETKKIIQFTLNGESNEIALSHSSLNNTITIQSGDNIKGYKSEQNSCDLEIDLLGEQAILHIRTGNGLSPLYYISIKNELVYGDKNTFCSLARDKGKEMVKIGLFTLIGSVILSFFITADEKLWGSIPYGYIITTFFIISPLFIIFGAIKIIQNKN